MNDWKKIVAHFRAELHRYFPDCPEYDIGVSGATGGPYTLTMTPDSGETETTWLQVRYDNEDYYTFKQKDRRRVITIPFMR